MHFVTSSIVHVDVLELMRELFANLNVVNTVNIAKHTHNMCGIKGTEMDVRSRSRLLVV